MGVEGKRVDVACGMKRMRQIMIKKKKKHLHFNLEAEGELHFLESGFFSLSFLLSPALGLLILSEFVILQFISFCARFNSILV